LPELPTLAVVLRARRRKLERNFIRFEEWLIRGLNLAFKCLKCGKCCRELVIPIVLSDIELWVKSGRLDLLTYVTEREARGWARRLGLEHYFTFVMRRGGCPFYRGGLCSIYRLRPIACRLFPFAYSPLGITFHPWAERNCMGIGIGEPLNDDELREIELLAKTMLRELLALPYYSTFIKELLMEVRGPSKALPPGEADA